MALVTLQAAIDHLKIPMVPDASPVDPRQADLEAKLAEAEAVILGYCEIADPDTLAGVELATVQAAIKLQCGALFRFRGDDAEGAAPPETEGYLSPTITNLLRRLRPPALA